MIFLLRNSLKFSRKLEGSLFNYPPQQYVSELFKWQNVERERSRFLTQQRALILRLLSRQLGDIPHTLQAPIQELSLDTLESLADALLDFNTIEDLSQWINRHL